MKREEYANTGIDIEIKKYLESASDHLIDIIDNDLIVDDDNDI